MNQAEYHSRWDEEHRRVCEDCYSDWYDEILDMIRDAELDAMAEAEGECEQGQRLVIDSVLNRVDNPHFPDTISEVIWQKNQYAGMYGDRITRCYVIDELVKLVEEELENRTDYDVVFFNADHYSDYGVPMFQVGNHYFSSYD